MSDGLYIKNIGKMDYSVGTYKCLLYDSGYTPDLNVDDALDDIPPSAIIVQGTLVHTFVNGVFDATDLVLTGVPASRTPAGGVIWRSSSSPQLLVFKFDSATNYSNLTTVTDGSNITILWPNDAKKIFRLKNA